MLRNFLIAFAAMVSVSACATRNSALSPRVLAAADPAAEEAAFSQPESAADDARPRTLGLEIADPARMKHTATPPETGTPAEPAGHDHSGHATPTPKPAATPKATPKPAAEAEAIYSCPMHPEVRDTKAGACPKCGMTLEPVPAPTPTSTPRPAAPPSPSPTGTPAPGGHEHRHGSAS